MNINFFKAPTAQAAIVAATAFCLKATRSVATSNSAIGAISFATFCAKGGSQILEKSLKKFEFFQQSTPAVYDIDRAKLQKQMHPDSPVEPGAIIPNEFTLNSDQLNKVGKAVAFVASAVFAFAILFAAGQVFSAAALGLSHTLYAAGGIALGGAVYDVVANQTSDATDDFSESNDNSLSKTTSDDPQGPETVPGGFAQPQTVPGGFAQQETAEKEVDMGFDSID